MCSSENPRSQVGTEKPNPHSAPGIIRTGVPRVGRRGKTPLRQPARNHEYADVYIRQRIHHVTILHNDENQPARIIDFC